MEILTLYPLAGAHLSSFLPFFTTHNIFRKYSCTCVSVEAHLNFYRTIIAYGAFMKILTLYPVAGAHLSFPLLFQLTIFVLSEIFIYLCHSFGKEFSGWLDCLKLFYGISHPLTGAHLSSFPFLRLTIFFSVEPHLNFYRTTIAYGAWKFSPSSL